MNLLIASIHYAARQFWVSRVFTAAAVLTRALGIGGTTAIFTLMPDIIRGLPKQTITVVPAGAGIGVMKEQYGPNLQILLAVCGLVLLTACANVANLLLARAVARRAQTAVRLAIGATGRQIIAEALTESVLLAVAGGLAGLLVAMGAARLLVALAFRSAHFVRPPQGPGEALGGH